MNLPISHHALQCLMHQYTGSIEVSKQDFKVQLSVQLFSAHTEGSFCSIVVSLRWVGSISDESFLEVELYKSVTP